MAPQYQNPEYAADDESDDTQLCRHGVPYVDRQAGDGGRQVDGALPATVYSRTARLRRAEFPGQRHASVTALRVAGQRPAAESDHHRGAVLRRVDRQRRDRQHHTVHNAAGRGRVRGTAARRRHRGYERRRVVVVDVAAVFQLVLAVVCAAGGERYARDHVRRPHPHAAV